MTRSTYLHTVRVYQSRVAQWMKLKDRGADSLQNAILAGISITIAVALGALLVAAMNNRSSGIQ